MLVDGSEKESSSVDIQNIAAGFAPILFPFVVIRSHLDPFRLEWAFEPPLPPFGSANLLYPIRAELSIYMLCRFRKVLFRNSRVFDLDPLRMWNPLRRECLELLDGMMRSIVEERSN